jgi:Protein of unknown function (DUF2844)
MSRKNLSTLLWSTAAASAALAMSSPGMAALGGDTASVSADRALIAGELHSTPMVQYDLHEITRGALSVREYATRAGQVFAVTWSGPVPPNLQALLGQYFPRFQAAAAVSHQANPGLHRHFRLTQTDLVIEQSGRLRDFRGIAYLPLQVPAGLSLDNLR